MVPVTKGECPEILAQNAEAWLADCVREPLNQTYKTRYRDPAIKEAVRSETSWKCVYCESRTGHNVPGDVEHILPVSIFPDLRFEWDNLTLACPECNRRKSNYFSVQDPFLNPYTDDVTNRLKHYGPVVGWARGDRSAEITVRTLDLHGDRVQLVMQKIEVIAALNSLLDRYAQEPEGALKNAIALDIAEMARSGSQFSAMCRTIVIGELGQAFLNQFAQ